MPLSFPASPTEGQTYSYGDGDWVYTSGAWVGSNPQGADRYGKTLCTAGEAIAAGQGVMMDRVSGKVVAPRNSPLAYNPAWGLPDVFYSDPSGYWYGTTGKVAAMGWCVSGTLNIGVIRDTPTGRLFTQASFPGASSSSTQLQVAVVYLGAEDKWAVIHHHTTAAMKVRMVQIDPATGSVTSLSDTTFAVTTASTAASAFGSRNPTTGVSFVVYEHESNSASVSVRALTYSGTTITLGTAFTTVHPAATTGSNLMLPRLWHTGRFTTFLIQRGGTRNVAYQSVIDTGATPVSMSQMTAVTVSLHNSGGTSVNVASNGNKVLFAHSYNNATYHAPVFQPGYIGDSGLLGMRGVDAVEWAALSPNTAGHRCQNPVTVVPYLDEPGAFHVLYLSVADTNVYTRKITVADDLTVTATTPALFRVGQTLNPANNGCYWTGYEMMNRDQAASSWFLFNAPRGQSGQELIGIAATSAAANQTLKVYTVGAIAPGYSGLTPGGMCYVRSGGGITQSQTYDAVRIGRAVSATEILVTL